MISKLFQWYTGCKLLIQVCRLGTIIQKSRIELLFTPVKPVEGGISGIWLRKSPSEILNADNVKAPLTCFGRQFQSIGPLTAKECLYSETTLAGTFRGTGGTVAVIPVILLEFSVSVKDKPMSLLVRLFKIFQV